MSTGSSISISGGGSGEAEAVLVMDPLPPEPRPLSADSVRQFFHPVDDRTTDHVFEWSLNDIFLVLCFSIPTLCLIFYVVKMLYRCCCSRNYAEWRSSWSQAFQAIFSRRYRRKRQIDPAKLFDAVPMRLTGHSEEIECVSSSLESPFVATHCIGGDVIVWDALSGECHTLIRRRPSLTVPSLRRGEAGTSNQVVQFKPHHRPTDSFSSDSTLSSSPSSSNSEAHYETAFVPKSHPYPPVSHANSMTSSTYQSQSSAVKNHRRHHSMSSIGMSASMRIGGGFRSQHQSQAYDFSAYFSRMNSSRELLTDLVRSAAASSTATQVHKVTPSPANSEINSQLNYRPIWTMEMFGKHVYVGCDNGRIEVWDALSGALCYFNDRSVSSGSSGGTNVSDKSGDNGVTVIRVNNTKMIVGYLDGIVETFHLQPHRNSLLPNSTSSSSGRSFDNGGSGSGNNSGTFATFALYYTLCHVSRAHRQPITGLEINSCYIMTGSLDHLVKVHSLDTGSHIYTLNGHCGGITAIEIDPMSPSTAVSGCQVGQLCVWDLQTGTCLFSVEAHPGASVSAILPTPHAIVTSGTDDKVFIWDKQTGNLVHSINQSHSMCKQMLLLSSNILVTARDDRLILYNISDGREVRSVEITDSSRERDHHSFHSNCMIKNLRLSSQSRAVVCDFGLQLCVIHFPSVADKYD